jgi:hypothetical protein
VPALSGIDGHRLHLHLPQRIPSVQKGLQNLAPDPLLLKFRKPPPGGLIGAIWAGPIAPPAADNPRTQDPVEDLVVIYPQYCITACRIGSYQGCCSGGHWHSWAAEQARTPAIRTSCPSLLPHAQIRGATS